MIDFLLDRPLLLAFCIFAARVVDVSMGTVRTIAVVRGMRWTSALIGFFEILIWIAAAGTVLEHLDRWYLALAYAGGFATGNLVGVWLEARLAFGDVLVEAVSENTAISLADALRADGYSLTEIQGAGEGGAPVEITIVVHSRRALRALLGSISSADPDAFYTIHDIRMVHSGLQVRHDDSPTRGWRNLFKRK